MLIKKILKIERRKRNWSQKSWKSRGEREIGLKQTEKFFSSLDNREEKEKLFFRFLKSRGERDMKISFSWAREKNLNNFSSRISRDRDSCQCLKSSCDKQHLNRHQQGESCQRGGSSQLSSQRIFVHWQLRRHQWRLFHYRGCRRAGGNEHFCARCRTLGPSSICH